MKEGLEPVSAREEKKKAPEVARRDLGSPVLVLIKPSSPAFTKGQNSVFARGGDKSVSMSSRAAAEPERRVMLMFAA